MYNKKLPEHKCKRCNHIWIPRQNYLPIICPGCKSPYWNKKRVRKLQQQGIE